MVALHTIAWVFLGLGLFSGLVVYIDISMGRYQGMAIMNIAWPITCLYSNVLGLFMYFKYGRAAKGGMMHHGSECHAHDMKQGDMHQHHHEMSHGGMHHHGSTKPFWVQIYISSTHCGAGCGAADIVSEILIYFAGITIFGYALYASFFIDYAFALLFGMAFQFFNIRPMRPELSLWGALKASFKADVLSLTSFQVGMYAWLLAVYYMFTPHLNAGSALYWFMMQIGLTIGLLTTYPVNYLLIKWGIKTPCAH